VHLAPEADRAVLRGLMEAVAEGYGDPKTERAPPPARTAGRCPVEVRAAAIEIDGRKGALVIARDLSQRQKAEELQSALYRIAQASARARSASTLFSPRSTTPWAG
jgi:hypothetical protein